MADPTNPSFETAGSNPGEAANWSQLQTAGGSYAADFDTTLSGDRPFEDFETSHDLPAGGGAPFNETSLTAFESTDLSRAVLDGNDQEDFEQSYYLPEAETPGDNQFSVLVFADSQLFSAPFDTTPEEYEDFEEEHDDPYGNPAAHGTTPTAYLNFSDIPAPPSPAASGSLAPFDTTPENYEDFEEEFGATSGAATYSQSDLGGTNDEEGWEAGWTSTMVW